MAGFALGGAPARPERPHLEIPPLESFNHPSCVHSLHRDETTQDEEHRQVMQARPQGAAPGVFILVAQAGQLCLHWPGADGMLATLDNLIGSSILTRVCCNRGTRWRGIFNRS